MKILIIEDEYNLADAISNLLTSAKYLVDIDTDGEEGLYDALTGIYDLIILDVMLPHKNGFEILKEIRNERIKSKVIMLTAKNTIEDKLNGLNNGADDYLTKPFHMDELVARVNIQLRNGNTYDNDLIELFDIRLDIKKMLLENLNNNKNISIIGKEFQLLEMFMLHPNQVLSKEQMFDKIWGYDSNSEMNSLEAYISFIRKKLKLIKSKTTIKSIRGSGYKLEMEDEEVKS
jgi:DNA-binding response OmpR family regulator